jgi:hypothetical protein
VAADARLAVSLKQEHGAIDLPASTTWLLQISGAEEQQRRTSKSQLAVNGVKSGHKAIPSI